MTICTAATFTTRSHTATTVTIALTATATATATAAAVEKQETALEKKLFQYIFIYLPAVV